MAAATDIRSTANKKSFYNKVKQHKRLAVCNPGDYPDQRLYAFDSGSVTVNTTNIDDIADELFVLKMPDGAKLFDLQVQFSDMDTGAALRIDIIAETDGGTETVLINSVNPTAAGFDELDRNLGYMFLDVGGQYLGFKVEAAATVAVAGTIRIKGLFYMGDLITGF